MAKASSMRWYGHVLRKEDEYVIVKALKFEVSSSRGRGRPKQTWKKQVENEMRKNGLMKEDACDRTKWHRGKDNYHTKSGQRRRQYRIQHMMMIMNTVHRTITNLNS